MKDQTITRPRVLIVNRAVVINKQKILLIKRSSKDEYEPGTWELPGGKLDEGQDISNALEHEVMEETGLLVQPINRLVFFDSGIATVYRKYKGLTFIRLVGVAKAKTSRIQLSKEHTDYKWLSYPDTLKMDLSALTRKALLALEESIKDYLWS